MKNNKLKTSLILVTASLLVAFFYFQVQAVVPVVQADLAPRIHVTESHITKISGNEIQGEFTILNSENYYLSDLNYEIKLFYGGSYENFKLIDVVNPAEIFFVAPGATIKKTFKYTYPKNITTGNYTLRTQVITSRGQELGWNDIATPLTGTNKFLDIFSDLSRVMVEKPASSNLSATDPVNILEQKAPISNNGSSTSESINSRTNNSTSTSATSGVGSDSQTKSGSGALNNESSATIGFSQEDVSIISDNREIARPLEGIVVSSTDNVYGYFKVKNNGELISVIPQIKIFKRQINMPVVKEYKESAITFAKGETKNISLKLPKLDIPESYLAEVKFYLNNEVASGIQYFRWVVAGDSGKIIYVKADKDYYKAGESISLTVQTTGPADASNGGQGQLEVIVSKKIGGLINKVSQNVSLAGGLVTSIISIPVKDDLISPAINVKLIKNGKVLDEQNINLPVFSEEAKKIEKSQKIFQLYVIILLMLLAIILVAGVILYKSKKK